MRSLLLLCVLMFWSSCSRQKTVPLTKTEDIPVVISGYTSGEVPSSAEIAISFVQSLEEESRKTRNVLSFRPSIAGEATWVNSRTLVFKPDQKLPNGTDYTASLDLDALGLAEENNPRFVFGFSVITQQIEVEVSELETEPGQTERQVIRGRVFTADEIGTNQLTRVLQAEQDGERLTIDWTSNPATKRHAFQITGIVRKEEASTVNVQWDGASINAKETGSRAFNVLPKGAFELIATKVYRNENPRVELTFSDPINTEQNWQGLIRLTNSGSMSVIVNENKMILSPRRTMEGESQLIVDAGIENRAGKKLGVEITRSIQFFQPKPQVAMLGRGTIIPRSGNVLFPFRAVSVGAVDVSITRIFETNVGQFLQESRLDQPNSWRMQYVGRRVFGEVIPLATLGTVDVGTWNNYALDLSELIDPEPGAIYQVDIDIRPQHAVYDCGLENEISNTDLSSRTWTFPEPEEKVYWNRSDRYYYPEGYSWRDRDNPCTISYYYNRRAESRNVLASDLGLIAKQDANGNLAVFTTDIRTAQPLRGVEITAFDLQQQSISSGISDENGFVQLPTERTPFYLMAEMGDQKGYLKVDDASSLSVSDFDVGGTRVQQGVKGFLYGERGVWRPGDSLFVTMMIEDETESLPENHPVHVTLRNPSGQVVDRQVFTQSLNGFYVYFFQTEKRAPTGNWRLTAQIGGISFSKQLKIESVKPNRLKVELEVENGRVIGTDRELEATVRSEWLHGATAANLKADVELAMTASEPDFPAFTGFSFYDPSVRFSSQPQQVFEGKLNVRGTVSFTKQLTAIERGPGRIGLNFRSRVYEPSGNFSIGRSTAFYYPFNTLVGIRSPQSKTRSWQDWLNREQPHVFEFAATDVDGKPKPFVELEYEVHEISWRWWWERGREELSTYFERRQTNRVLTGKATTQRNGKVEVPIELPESAKGGRYLVRVNDPEGGHSAGSTVYFRWYGGRNTAASPARLTLETNKEQFDVGEQVELTIPSARGSRILVSLENGSSVIRSEWVDGEAGQTTFRFFAEPEMSPTIYAHVMHIQPHGQTQNDLPIRMYGVIPITINDPETRLVPQLFMDAELKPETQTVVEVSEENGKPMTYTLAMVDEGLLDLTAFKTPEPHSHFYAREALGVKTWDLYDVVSDHFAGNLARIFSIGGDAEGAAANPLDEANRFKPMVRFLGPFELEPGEVNRHTLSMPNYVGSVRTMVIAGQDGAYGQVEQTTPVRKPVMVLATLPRVLGPAETVQLPVSVFAMKENVKNVQIRVQANELFEPLENATATARFSQPGDKVIPFTLKTRSRTGVGKVRVEVSGGGETAYHEIEIAVRNPNTPFSTVRSDVLSEGETAEFMIDPQGMLGTNNVTLELSRMPPLDLKQRLNYLLRYPHGCIEQTTSSAFPQLFLGEVVDLNSTQQTEAQRNIEQAITRLNSFLHFTGGLSYWPGSDNPDAWGTNYAYHFLLEAMNQGYYVPRDLLSKINDYQRKAAQSWKKNERYRRSELTQAYRLYTLSLAGTPDLGAMNRLREQVHLNPVTKWRLAAAYMLAGQKEATEDLVMGVDTSVPEYRELSGTFGSSVRDRALILETLSLLGREEDAMLVVRDLSLEMSSRNWYSTQTTAYTLIAISKFASQLPEGDRLNATFAINATDSGVIESKAFIAQTPLVIDEMNTNQVSIRNTGEGSLFVRLIEEGLPLIGDTLSTSNSLTQTVRFLDLNGRELNPNRLPQGTDFIAEVTLTNPGLRGLYEEMALTQIFPSGWEIRNVRMENEAFNQDTSPFDYQDIRDDRVYTYFSLNPSKSKVFRLQLSATYAGEYYLPAVSTSAMYDESISARTAGNWVTVQSYRR
ncbi:MAG: MG2 domain-containing protein [Bacteroidota bacterium]